MSIYDVFSGGSKPFDKAEWAAQKQAQRQEAYELIDNTCSEMMADGESFRQYLDVQGRFDRYSVANAVLVSAQMPDATQLKDYNAWKQSRVYVNKDAQKIVILEPSKSAEGATMTKEKPSVREKLRKIKESRKEQEAEIGTSDLDKSGASDRAKSANRKTEHKQPQRKKKKPKSKETR